MSKFGSCKASEACLAVEAQVAANHLLINDFTQLQTGYAASKSTSNSAQHSARADTHRAASCTSLHADSCTSSA